ncbi:ImmA/IrrE family metallo-endopeptidase [Limosilactobacillus mucosae]|uniref:ImmA/IrrE family metallo-endopeptidase n=1 Tax=Limosilactobacillus mucosae TaxID=97478 RepID=UPI0015D530FF|nr:ImmA/IrrE family metallo-endopeptidase [Limosilactobacillus mucosae]QLI94524.1 ImmA/IrrE family metallo-endopeptidase [Limosilactobacillus mucosae]
MDVRNIVKQLNINVYYIDMEKPGYATISADKQLKFVFISNRYPARVQKVTLIHELEHIAKQSGQTALYNATVSARLKWKAKSTVALSMS